MAAGGYAIGAAVKAPLSEFFGLAIGSCVAAGGYAIGAAVKTVLFEYFGFAIGSCVAAGGYAIGAAVKAPLSEYSALRSVHAWRQEVCDRCGGQSSFV